MKRYTGLAIGGAVAIGVLTGGCTTNPTTGRKQFATMSHTDEVALGAQAAPQLTQEFGGAVQDGQLTGYVSGVGSRLKDQTEVDGPQRQWVFTLLDSEVINAFALPGERVFLSRGLAVKMDNEAQMAGVLGHEIGHVMARHTSERMSQSTIAGIGSAVAGAVAGAAIKDPTLGQTVPALVDQGGQVVLLKFSRDQESEADSLGMRYMAKAGYNPEGQLQVMQILKRESGAGNSPEWLATHPLPETRITRVRGILNKDYANTKGNQQYQFYPERFQQQFLSRLATLPPPPKVKTKAEADGSARGMMAGAAAARGGETGEIVWADPTTWCAHCRPAAVGGP